MNFSQLMKNILGQDKKAAIHYAKINPYKPNRKIVDRFPRSITRQERKRRKFRKKMEVHSQRINRAWERRK